MKVELVLFRLVSLNCFGHDADFGNQQDGEEYQEEEEGGLNGREFEMGHSGVHRQHVLDGPGLAAYFCDNPAGLLCNIHQRYTPQTDMEQPTLIFQLMAMTEPAHEEQYQ